MNLYLQEILRKKIITQLQKSYKNDKKLNDDIFVKERQNWTHQDFEEVSCCTLLHTQFLKRLFEYGNKQSDFQISSANRLKIIEFLGYPSWEDLETELILRAGVEIFIEKFLKKDSK